MKATYCTKCQHYSLNMWGYIECWKFDREIDHLKTTHTAQREKDALNFNKDNQCPYFVSIWFKWIRRLFCKHPKIDFVKNLYEQEIIDSNGCRSLWECRSCGMPIYKDNFVPKAEQGHGRAT